jgi:hypothetical protein
MSEYQKQRYHDLLVAHAERLRALRKNTDWRQEEARRRFAEDLKGIQQEFDGAFLPLLAADQSQSYQSLPAWEKGIPGGGQVFFTQTGSGEGGEIDVPPDVLGVDFGAVEVLSEEVDVDGERTARRIEVFAKDGEGDVFFKEASSGGGTPPEPTPVSPTPAGGKKD